MGEIDADMDTCVFCRVASGKEPHAIIAESKHSLAIMDKHPFTEGHSLVIPKRHYNNVMEAPQEELSDLIGLIAKTEKALIETVKSQGMDIRQNYRPFLPETELVVRHVHFHLIPRNKDDDLYIKALQYETVLRKQPTLQQMEELAKRIKAKL